MFDLVRVLGGTVLLKLHGRLLHSTLGVVVAVTLETFDSLPWNIPVNTLTTHRTTLCHYVWNVSKMNHRKILNEPFKYDYALY